MTIPTISFMLSGEAYRALPQEQRRVYLVGALDMLYFTSIYFAPEYKSRVDALIEYASRFRSGELGQRFDDYMNSTQDDVQKDGASGAFFGVLNRWNESAE